MSTVTCFTPVCNTLKVEEKTFIFMCYGMKISKPEVATVVLMIVFPLLFVWIPFATNSYGPFATWCWIHSLEQNCTTNTVGMWEQIWLWDVPFGIVFFLTLVLLIGSLCLLGYGIKNAKVHNYKLIEVGITDYLLLLVLHPQKKKKKKTDPWIAQPSIFHA